MVEKPAFGRMGLVVAVVSVCVGGFSVVLLRLPGLSPAGSLYLCRSGCVKVSVREMCVPGLGASLLVNV